MAGVTEVDRQRVVDELERRAAAGELSPEELADRTRRARTVVTVAGLDGILLDLPGASTELPTHASHWFHSSASSHSSAPAPAGTGWVPPGGAHAGSGSGSGRAPGHRPVARPSPWGSPIVVVVAVVAVVVMLLGAVVGLAADGSGSGSSGRPEIPDPPAPASTAPPSTTEATELQVGVDIEPGVFTTAGAQPTACSWQRTGRGSPSTVVAEGASVRPLIEVLPSDGRVRLRDCSPLVPYVAPPTPATSVGDGDWLVGQDIVPGHYRVAVDDPDAGPSCRWTRARGLGYGPAEVIETASVARSDPAEVDLADGERFSLSGCGTWTLG